MRPTLTDALLDFLKTGTTEDADVFLDYARPGEAIRRDGRIVGHEWPMVRALYQDIRDDYPAGAFPWAEKELAR